MEWFRSALPSSLSLNGFLYILSRIGTAATAPHFQALSMSRLSCLPRLFPGWWEEDAAVEDIFFHGAVAQETELCAGFVGATCRDRSITNKLKIAHVHEVPHAAYCLAASNILGSTPPLPPFSLCVWRVTPCYSTSNHVYGKPTKEAISKLHWHWGLKIPHLMISKPPNTELLTLISFIMTIVLCIQMGITSDGPGLTALLTISLCSSRRGYIWNHFFRTRRQELDRSSGSDLVIAQTQQEAFHLMSFHYVWLGGACRHKATCGCHMLGDDQRVRDCHQQAIRMSYLDVLRIPIILTAACLLANSKLLSQITIASSYLIMTCLYWVVPPSKRQPNLNVAKIFPSGTRDLDLPNLGLRSSETRPSLARTLWHCVRLTGSTRWVYDLGVVPKAAGWDLWLKEAHKNAHSADWPANAEKLRLVDGDDHVYDNEQQDDLPQRLNRPSSEIAPIDDAYW